MTLLIAHDSIDDLLHEGLKATIERGEEVDTSRGTTLELRGARLELRNPLARVSRSSAFSHMFSALAETVWYLSGDRSHLAIEYYLPSYMRHVGVGSGAYGPRLFGDGGQVHRVIQQLRGGSSTRQAVIQLFDADDLAADPKDVPCTCTLQFLQRNGQLDLVVYMRSNDFVQGFRHDVFAFTFIQELVARSIDVELGTYVHMVGSLHVYTKHSTIVERFIGEGVQASHPMPAMPPGDPWAEAAWLVEWERASRTSVDLPSAAGVDWYWVQLAQLLSGFHAFRSQDESALATVQGLMAGSVYSLFLSDRAYILEDKILDA